MSGSVPRCFVCLAKDWEEAVRKEEGGGGERKGGGVARVAKRMGGGWDVRGKGIGMWIGMWREGAGKWTMEAGKEADTKREKAGSLGSTA